MGLLKKSEQDQLVAKLEKLPGIAFNWYGIRAQLLNGVPMAVVGNVPVTGIPRIDLMTLVDTVEGSGLQLADGTWAIVPIIENAIMLARGLSLERELRELHLLALSRSDVRRVEGMELEALLNARTGFQSVAIWAEQLFRVIRPVCRIDIDGAAQGSGFLIGPNLVLTNHHVTHFRDGTAIPLGRLSTRFDHHRLPDGTSSPGIPYPVADEPLPNSPVAELDFALLRTTGTPADDAVNGVADNPLCYAPGKCLKLPCQHHKSCKAGLTVHVSHGFKVWSYYR